MALIFPDICRYSIIGTYNGEDCINVIDVKLSDNSGGASRATEVGLIAGDILNNWATEILPLMVPQYTFLEVRWVDLDTANGSTGSRTATSAETLPQSGTANPPGLPGNVYAKVVKTLDQKSRQSRNGVLRLGACPESGTAVDNTNQLTQGYRDLVTLSFENFKDGINGAETGGTRNIGVLHTVAGVATGFTFVANFNCALTVGTLRRRMPGYGD